MRFIAFVWVSFLAFSTAVAEEPAPQFAEQVLPGPVACPGANCGELERIRHLMQAATHLAAAGKHNDAAQLRTEAEEARERLLAGKLAELAALQAQIEQLRGELAAPAQIRLQIRWIALSSKSLREAGVDLADANESVLNQVLRGELLHTDRGHARGFFGVVDGDDAELAVLEDLRSRRLVTTLSKPKLITVSGHACASQLQIGHELPVESAPGNVTRRFCMQLECLPERQASGMIRLGLRHRLSQQGPPPRVREIEAAAELRPGQVFVVGGLAAHDDLIPRGKRASDGPQQDPNEVGRQTEAENDETEFLILVKPSLLESTPELSADRRAERARFEEHSAPSSRRVPHSPRPFQVPSYQTPIRC